MSDRLTKVSIDSILYDLGSRGINSYETLADMVAEEIGNLYDGCIAYCVEDEKYYQWKSINEIIATYARWRELQFGNKFQVDEMPTPTAELDGSIVQFTGETNATYKRGWFYTCVFANEGYVQTSCTADTRGDYYLKGDDGNYTLVQLDGTNFDSSATYYQKVNAVSRWDEISTQSTDNKVDKIEGKCLSTNDLTDKLKENYDNASDKAHEHTNKGTLDKLSMSTDGNLTVEKETDVSLELLYGKSLTKNQYEQMVTDGTIQDDMVYVVDEEDADAGWIINDSSTTATDKTWSAKKISSSTISYILIDTTKDIDFNEYIETGYYTPNRSFSTGWFTHSILNAPTNGWLPAGGFALEVKTFDNTSSSKWCTQVLYSYVGTDNNSAPMYTRTFFYDGSKVIFSPWKRIADIDDSKVSSEETWSSKKINDTTVLKNTKILYKNAPTSSGMTTFTLDTSSLGLTHGIYHFKCYIVGNGNVAHCAEGSIGQYDGSYYISIDYKSSHISSIVINGTTITVTTSAAHYNLSFSIQSIYDWAEA